MKNLFTVLIIISFFIFSCKNNKEEQKIDKKEITVTKKKNDSCKFSYIDQSSKFIDSLPELKGYLFDKGFYSKKLSENEVIKIDRFGCNEFYMETKITTNKEIQFSEEFVINKINRILDLLPNEYETELIKSAIKNKELSFYEQAENRIFSKFKNEQLDDLITVFYHLESDKTSVSLNMFRY